MIKVNAIAYAWLIKALRRGDMTLADLAEETGLHYLTVALYTRALHKVGVIHISDWAPDPLGRMALKIYKLGPGSDAKRRPLTPAERSQRRRDKKASLNVVHRPGLGLVHRIAGEEHGTDHPPIPAAERRRIRRNRRKTIESIQLIAGPLPPPATQHRSEHAESL